MYRIAKQISHSHHSELVSFLSKIKKYEYIKKMIMVLYILYKYLYDIVYWSAISKR